MRNKILGVKMTDYLKIYEKFKDVKEVKDYIDDVILLRHYYTTTAVFSNAGAYSQADEQVSC